MSYDVVVTRLPLQALFDLKGDRDALSDWTGKTLPPFPNAPKTQTRKDGATLSHIGPDHWLLRADLTREATLETALKPGTAPPEISIVRVSDTLTFFRITGPDAAEALSIGCPMDIHHSQFPADAVSFSEFFSLKALITRQPDGFDVAVDQSYGDMIAAYLARAVG